MRRTGVSLACLALMVAAGSSCQGRVMTNVGSGTTGSTTAGGTGGAGGSTGTSVSSSGQGGGGGAGTTSGTGGGPKGCHQDTDCHVGWETCLPPGGFAGCGTCSDPPTTCVTDAECASQGPTSICTTIECTCSAKKTCALGCTSDAMCATGEACAASHHCQAKPCASASDCPTNFVCQGAGALACQRKTCTADAMCQGACVKGACYDAPGTCTPLPQ